MSNIVDYLIISLSCKTICHLKSLIKAMKTVLLLSSIISSFLFNPLSDYRNVNPAAVDVNLIELSQSLLLAAKTKDSTGKQLNTLKNVNEHLLEQQLKTDDQKKAFWINIYNAYTQVLLTKDPDRYKKRSSFFSSKSIIIAGHNFSLDDIEHGILRRSKNKLSFGYFNKLFPSALERKLRVDTLDYRIHFALNCGAKSCPPIAFYKPDQLNKQLDIATNVYLHGESDYKPDEDKVYVPALMGWFRADFKGKNGIRKILKSLSIIPVNKNPTVHFKKYNWNLYLENFKNE